jgi:hypothetical protein
MIAAAVLAAQYAGTLDALDATKVDARANNPPIVLQSPSEKIVLAADVSTMPTARLHLGDRRWDYTLTVSPILSVTDLELGSNAQPLALAAGGATIGWHDRLVRVMVSESASYGVESLGYIYENTGVGTAGQPGPMGQTVGQTGVGTSGAPATAGMATSSALTPNSNSFILGSTITSGSLAVTASRQVTLFLSGGYSVSGNLSPPKSRSELVLLPEQFGPFGSASLTYAVSRVDALVSLASAQETTTPQGECYTATTAILTCRLVQPIFQAQELVRHRLSTTATFSAGVGASASIQEVTNGEAWVILPTGILTFTDRFSALDIRDASTDRVGALDNAVRVGALDNRNTSILTASLQLAPVVEINTGQPNNIIQFTTVLTNPVAPSVFLSVNAGAQKSVPPDPFPLTALNAGIDARLRINRQIDINVGVTAFWQTQTYNNFPTMTGGPTTTATATTTAEVGYVTFTARAPTLRF